MAGYAGDYNIGSNVDVSFTTIAAATGAPTTLSGTPVISAYVGNSTTEITAGITLSVDFDARTGLNHVRVVATTGNGFAAGTDVSLVITTGTVGGTSVVGYEVASFSLNNRVANVTQIGGVSTTAPVGAIPSAGILDSGTLQSATGTTATIRASASFGDSTLNGHTIWITGGTGIGQSRYITGWVNSTKVATVDTWTTTPDSTSTYLIFPTAPGSATSPSPVNVVQWNSTTVATPATAGVPEVNVRAINNLTASGVTAVNANQGTTQPINFTGTGASALAKSDMVDIAGAAVSTTTAQIGTNVVTWKGQALTAPSVSGFPDVNVQYANNTAWNGGSITGSTFAVSSGSAPVDNGQAQAGGATSLTLKPGSSSVNNYYNNDLLFIGAGTGLGQSRYITAYNGTTKVATVSTAWATTPDSTSIYVIIPGDAIPGATAPTAAQVATAVWQDLTSSGDFGTAGSVGLQIKTNLDAQTSLALQPTVAGRKLDVSAGGEAGLDWANIGSPSTSQNLSQTIISQATNAPSAGDLTATMKTSVENSVLDASAASHNTAGTVGQKINSAASATDPLQNPIGTYTGSQIGTLIQGSAQTTTVMKANVTQVNNSTVTGSGTESDPWGPA